MIVAHEFGHAYQVGKRVVTFFPRHEAEADSRAVAECQGTGRDYHEMLEVLLTGLAYSCKHSGLGRERYLEAKETVMERARRAARDAKKEHVPGRKDDFEVIADLLIREAKRGGEKEAV